MRDLAKRDRELRERFAEAVGVAVKAGRPELSVAQIAAGLSGGVDDPGPVGEKTLYAVQEGRRPLWPHKVAALVALTGCVEPLRVLAGGCGYLVVRAPEGLGEGEVLGAVREHGEAMVAVAGALERGLAGSGRGMTAGEWDRVEREVVESLEATAGLLEAVRVARGRKG